MPSIAFRPIPSTSTVSLQYLAFTCRSLGVLGVGAAFWGAALAAEAPPSMAAEPQGSTSPSGSPAFLAPYKYVPSNATKKPENQAPAPQRSPEQQHLVELNASGDYSGVVREGTALMAKEKPDPELQLIFANSLAWTGHLQTAAAVYTDLTKGPYSNEAYIGLANVERWLGRDDLALPHYRTVLERDPANNDANEGQELATRELRPRTAVSFGTTDDSSNMRRRAATINHRWRGNGGTTIYEVETNAVDDALPTQQTSRQDVTLRVQDVGLALKPSLELSTPTGGDRQMYASARIKFDEDRESLEIGSVNWGKLALNANALAAQLSASHLGFSAIRTGWMGSVSGRVDYYQISDGNILTSGRLQFSPSWRPVGPHLKPFLSVESRKSSFNTLNYWSPDQGSVSLYAGALAEWGYADWNMFLSAQSGVGLSGEAGNGWSVTAGGKRWVSSDIALSMNLWSMSSWRDNANYRSQAATVTMEKLWR